MNIIVISNILFTNKKIVLFTLSPFFGSLTSFSSSQPHLKIYSIKINTFQNYYNIYNFWILIGLTNNCTSSSTNTIQLTCKCNVTKSTSITRRQELKIMYMITINFIHQENNRASQRIAPIQDLWLRRDCVSAGTMQCIMVVSEMKDR